MNGCLSISLHLSYIFAIHLAIQHTHTDWPSHTDRPSNLFFSTFLSSWKGSTYSLVKKYFALIFALPKPHKLCLTYNTYFPERPSTEILSNKAIRKATHSALLPGVPRFLGLRLVFALFKNRNKNFFIYKKVILAIILAINTTFILLVFIVLVYKK